MPSKMRLTPYRRGWFAIPTTAIIRLTAIDDRSNIRAMDGQQSRDQISRTGADLVARRGFNNTGLTAVLSAAGVPKGSFYYYFEDKEAFGLALVDHLAAEYSARLDRFLLDSSTPPLVRLRAYFEAGMSDMTAYDYGRGCPIGNLSQELASQNERFRYRLQAVFADWVARFERCLIEAKNRGEIAETIDTAILAECVLSGWEGATLRAKVTRSTDPMTAFVTILFDRVLVG